MLAKAIVLSCLLAASVWAAEEDTVVVAGIAAVYDSAQSILGLECRLVVPPGWHINSDSVIAEYYTPTGFSLWNLEWGERIQGVYPKAQVKALLGEAFPVFEGEVHFANTFKMRRGHAFPVALRLHYQACTEEICLPPKVHPVIVDVVEEGGVRVEY
jgi:hypothetical protein